MGLTGLKSRCLQGRVPSGGSRGGRGGSSLCLSSFYRLPAFLGSWPLPPPSKQQQRPESFSCRLSVLSPASSSTLEDPSAHTGPPVTQDNPSPCLKVG